MFAIIALGNACHGDLSHSYVERARGVGFFFCRLVQVVPDVRVMVTTTTNSLVAFFSLLSTSWFSFASLMPCSSVVLCVVSVVVRESSSSVVEWCSAPMGPSSSLLHTTSGKMIQCAFGGVRKFQPKFVFLWPPLPHQNRAVAKRIA